MSIPLAHAQDWLEPLLFAPAFAIVLAAIVRDRRDRRRAQAADARSDHQEAP